MVWFSGQISLENIELNNIRQFFKVKKKSVEVIGAFIRLMNIVTVQEGRSGQRSPGGRDHETTGGFVFFLIPPADCPLKLPWACRLLA